MPEGDTIHRTAASLRATLGADPLTTFEAPGVSGPEPTLGEAIEQVQARGKHLLLTFGGGSTLHTHMGMHGSWRLQRPGEGVRPFGADTRPGTAARVGTDLAVATCRSAAVVELLTERDLERHPVLRALGPDLCLPDADLDEVLRRLEAVDPGIEIGVVLLDQRPACGIGNVYRAEVLWACRVHPFITLGKLDRGTRRELYATAGRLLRANLQGHPRRTVPQGLAVYERGGRPCRRCGTPILARRQGEQARTSWWCPACQTAPAMDAHRREHR